MRIFEILIIVASLLTLLVSVRKRSMAVCLGSAAITLLALLLHSVIEGVRYQMAFAYFFVALLVIYVMANASGRFAKIRIPQALKVVAISLSLALLTFTAFVAHALPVFTLPKPTGDNAVGIKYVHLVDAHRADPFLSKPRQKRELMVKVYYPAKPDDSKPFSPYFHGSPRLLRAWAAFYQMPPLTFDHFKLVMTYAKDDLEPSDAQPSYPVVLFFHGAGATMEVGTSQGEDLASHGYIVMNIDSPYVSAATEFPNRLVIAQEATTNFDTPEPAEPITQIMAEDGMFVLEKLGEMNAGKITPFFKGKLSLAHIGVIGHSVGGAAAYNLAINDHRVKAAINLDGAVYVTPKDTRNIAPFLMLANDKYHVQAIAKRESLMRKFDATPESQQELRAMYGSQKAYQTVYDKAQRDTRGLVEVLKASGDFYTIDGSDHMKFTDIGLFIGSKWLRDLVQINGKTDPAYCLEITQALTTAFFDQHLKGQAGDTLTPLTKIYPELKKVTL